MSAKLRSTTPEGGAPSANRGPGRWSIRLSYAVLLAAFSGLCLAAYWRTREPTDLPRRPSALTAPAGPGVSWRAESAPNRDTDDSVVRVEAALDDSEQGRLVSAAAAGDRIAVRDLLERGVAADARNRDGRGALHLAAANGEIEMLRLLLDAGATVDAADGIGWGALHWAAYYGSLPSVEALLAAGADPNARFEPHRVTALEQLLSGLRSAETRGGVPFRRTERVAIAESLLAAGADPNLGGPYGPPLRLAPHLDGRLVLALLDHGARVDDLPELRRMVAHSGALGLRFREAFREADFRASRTPRSP